MNCTQCGNPIDNGSAWCSNCGAKVERDNAQQPAAQFNQPVSQTQQFAVNTYQTQTNTTVLPNNVNNANNANNANFSNNSNVVSVKMSKKNKIILSIVGVLVIALGAAYYAIQNYVYSPEATMKRYVNALESGNFTEASKLVEWSPNDIQEGSRILLTNEVGKKAKNRIENPVITNVSFDSSVVSYKINGKETKMSLQVSYPKTEWLIFKSYKLYPRVKTMYVTVPNSVKKIKINGYLIDLPKYKKQINKESQFGYSEETENTRYSFPTYPGSYRVEASIDTPLLKVSDPKEVVVASSYGSAESAEFYIDASKKLEKKIVNAVKKQIKQCVSASNGSATPAKICAFGTSLRKRNLGLFTAYDYSYSDVKRSVDEYPKLVHLNIGSGSFFTDGFEETVTFRRKASNKDEWSDGKTIQRFHINGVFKIKGDDVSIKFKNDTYQEEDY